MSLEEDEKKNIVEIKEYREDSDGKLNAISVVRKQFEVEVDKDGTPQIAEKEPVNLPPVTEAALQSQVAYLKEQLANTEFLLTKFDKK